MTRQKTDRTYQYSSSLSNIHYASINKRYISPYFWKKNVLSLIIELPRIVMAEHPYTYIANTLKNMIKVVYS